MRRIVPLLCLTAAAACADSPVEVARTPEVRLNSTAAAAPSRYAVLFKESIPRGFVANVVSRGGKVELVHEDAGIALVSSVSADALSALRRDAAIDAVTTDFTHQLVQVREPVVKMADLDVADVGATSHLPPTTARWYPLQWNLPAVGAPTAWANGVLGSSDVTVAILDSGLDYLHPDFNGLVDVANSVSFVPSDDALVAALFPGRHPMSDLNGHGSIIASIVSSNGHGNAGVTSRVKLMGVKVLGLSGSGTFGGIIEGILHATDRGADVINMSLGIDAFPRNEEGAREAEKFVDRLTKYARSAGVTVVVAAGNEGLLLAPNSKGLVAIFCSSKNVICVTGTGPLSAGPNDAGPFLPHVDLWGSYSTHGKQAVDVAAPGGNESATTSALVWGACSRTWIFVTDAGAFLPCFTTSPTALRGTLGGIGTSSAAPHVAALAALLVERMGRNPGAIEAAIQNSSDDVPFGEPGMDDQYGHGRINVTKALGL